MNSCRSPRLNAHVSTTCSPWVLMTVMVCPWRTNAALPRRAGMTMGSGIDLTPMQPERAQRFFRVWSRLTDRDHRAIQVLDQSPKRGQVVLDWFKSGLRQPCVECRVFHDLASFSACEVRPAPACPQSV